MFSSVKKLVLRSCGKLLHQLYLKINWTMSDIHLVFPGEYLSPNLTLTLCVICPSVPLFHVFGANFSGNDLFLVWRRETPPHPQLLSGETRASTCQPATTQAHTVAFSVLDIQGCDGTQDIQFHKLSYCPSLMAIFVSSVANVQVT